MRGADEPQICYLSNLWVYNPNSLYLEASMLSWCAAAGAGVGALMAALSMALTIIAFTAKQESSTKSMSPKGKSNRFAPPSDCGEHYTLRSLPSRHHCGKSIGFTRH